MDSERCLFMHGVLWAMWSCFAPRGRKVRCSTCGPHSRCDFGNWWISIFKYLSCRWMVRFIYLLVRRDMYILQAHGPFAKKRGSSQQSTVTVSIAHSTTHKHKTTSLATTQQSELLSSFIYAPVCRATVNLKMGLTFEIKPFNIAFESYSVDLLNFIFN